LRAISEAGSRALFLLGQRNQWLHNHAPGHSLIAIADVPEVWIEEYLVAARTAR